jgi:hypothetical protein
MDAVPDTTLVERYMTELDDLELTDRQSALDALSHLVFTVSQVNQILSMPESDKALPLQEGLIDKVRKWLKKLISKLEQIAKALGERVSFSVSIGSQIAVTVNFPSYHDTQHSDAE